MLKYTLNCGKFKKVFEKIQDIVKSYSGEKLKMRESFLKVQRYVGAHTRKLICSIVVSAMFVCSASFCSIDSGTVTQDTVAAGQVYIETDGGMVSIDRMESDDNSDEDYIIDEDDELSVSANDLAGFDDIEIEEKTSDDNNNLTVAEDTVIIDENGNTEEATYENDWSLMLINKEHHIPDDYDFEVATIKGAVRSDVRVVPYVKELIEAAAKDGVQLYICSPYRDLDKQEQLFEKKVRFYIKQGYNEADSYELASQTVAIPGTSEHQAGLAFDFIMEDYQQLDEGFENTAGGRWLKENAADYGFILRYPKGKEDITKIIYEPWHYRFVGVDAAKEIMSRGITLEEYDKEIGLAD